MQQVQIQLAGLPITLVLLSNGSVVLVPMLAFTGIIENVESQPVWANFYPDCFSLFTAEGGDDFDYRVPYDIKLYPLLVQWLKQQNLISPF